VLVELDFNLTCVFYKKIVRKPILREAFEYECVRIKGTEIYFNPQT